MKLPLKEIELVAIGASIAAGCLPCTAFHQQAAQDAGASQGERDAAVQAGLAARHDAEDALRLFLDSACSATGSARIGTSSIVLPAPAAAVSSECGDRVALLINVAAAVALNDAAGLGTAIAAAQCDGIDDEALLLVAGLTARIKEKAASHLQANIAALNAPTGTASAAAHLCT